MTAFGDSDDEQGQYPGFEGGPESEAPEPEPDTHDPDPAAPDSPVSLPGPAYDQAPSFNHMDYLWKLGVIVFGHA